jgi:carboxymethylenebutenolidase
MPDDKPLLTAKDFHPEVLRLFDKYVHGGIDRRGFLDGVARHAVGGVTAAGLLAALSPQFAQAQKVAPSDPRIRVQTVDIPSPQGYGTARAMVAKPAKASGKLPVVLVAHENRGLNPHIEDIARRLAIDGFITVAPDALHPLGGYPGDEDKAREAFAKLDQAKTREDFVAAARYAQALPDGNGRLGAVGFCWGGGTVNMLATRVPTLAAGVPFYGIAPPLEAVPSIKAELLLNFASEDERINASWPPYEAALKKAGVKYEAHTYPNTQHGFNNDTTPRFDAAAAKLAWDRTLALFRKTLQPA